MLPLGFGTPGEGRSWEKGAELGWGCPAPGLGCRRQPHGEPCGWARLEPAAPVGSRHGVAGSWVPEPLLLLRAAPQEWFISGKASSEVYLFISLLDLVLMEFSASVCAVLLCRSMETRSE